MSLLFKLNIQLEAVSSCVIKYNTFGLEIGLTDNKKIEELKYKQITELIELKN